MVRGAARCGAIGYRCKPDAARRVSRGGVVVYRKPTRVARAASTLHSFNLSLSLSLSRPLTVHSLYPHVTLHITRRLDPPKLESSVIGGSEAEWLACWTRAQKGPGSNRSRDAVGKQS